MAAKSGVIGLVLDAVVGAARAERLFSVLVVPQGLLAEPGPRVSRAGIAQALNMLLFEDLIGRVPAAQMYVEHCLQEGRTVMHDHGAVRTVARAGMGALPGGQEALVRLLRPLGYVLLGVYPLERLKMTGRSWAQADMPEEIAQFFISELHPERFTADFQAAVERVTAGSLDPLTDDAGSLLGTLEAQGSLTVAQAAKLLPGLVACFARQHPEPAMADYEMLLGESAEMAWISTEGNAFNHATDRVEDVDTLAAEQKGLGQPMKEVVETSQSQRVRQTAFHAARVKRGFRGADGERAEREVPGSFLEFITRLPITDETGKTRLDLSFDPANAQAIFKMTANR